MFKENTFVAKPRALAWGVVTRSLLVVAFTTTGLSLLSAAGAGVYAITELFSVGSSSAARGNTPFISALAGGSDESASPRSFDVDEDGSIVISLSVSTRKGWEPVDAESAFRKANGRKPSSTDELAEWRKSGYRDTPPASDEERLKAWDEYMSGPNRRHPGVRPVIETKIVGLRIKPDGKMLEKRDEEIAARRSTLFEPKAFASDDPLVAWFNQNVPLPEYADRRREIKFRDGKELKSQIDEASFAEGSLLGERRNGDRVYLMNIAVPWNRPHIHGASDFVDRVYVLSPERKVLFSKEAYPNIKMQKDTGDLFELYSGPYKGLMPSLEPVLTKSWTMRRWKAD